MTTQLLEQTTIDGLVGDTQATQHNPTLSSRTIDAGKRHIALLVLLQYATTPLLSMLWLGAPAAALLGLASWLQTAAMTQVMMTPCNEEPAAGTDDDEEELVYAVPEGWEEDGDEGSEL